MNTKAVVLRSLLVFILALVPSTPALYAQDDGRQLYIPSISGNNDVEPPGVEAQAAELPYGSSLDIALNYIRTNRASWGLTAADVADMVVKDHYTTRHNGVTHTVVRQRWQGIEVFNGDIQINVMADGSILNVHNHFIPDLAHQVNTTEPSISAVAAVNSSVQYLGLQPTSSLEVVQTLDGAGQEVRVSDGGLTREAIPASLVYFNRGGVRLAWNVSLELRGGASWPNVRVDAVTGAVLSQSDWVDHDAYRVFPTPYESPYDGPAVLVTDTADALASPFGWHDTDGAAGAETDVTSGNNVSAQEDLDANDLGGFQPTETSSGLVFDYAFDAALQPTEGTNQQAAIVNLFYQNNIIHDILYHYGFDEASGNFQFTNYGPDGLGNDHVMADAQDGSDINNANFGTPPDGQSPRMQMFQFDLTTPRRDSDMENGVIAHEYGHGVSNRLTGGPANVECLNNQEQMGEGWSDFIALVLTAKPSQTATTARGMGAYLLGQPVGGPGIRLFPYSTDMSVNPQTYDAIKSVAIPHGVGSVWAQMLWEMYWGLVDQYGFDADLYSGAAGNNLALQLVMDGMKLQTCSPGFVDGRDAILLADQTNNAGANQCTIWAAFAKRGLGFSADQGDSGSVADGTEAFDLPRNCIDEVQLEKSASLSVAFADSIVTYALTATNYTSVTLTGVVITDAVPSGSTYEAGSASDGGSEAGGVVTWDLGTLDVDEAAARTFVVTVDSPIPPTAVLFEDDMENDGSGWTATGLWHQEDGTGNCSNANSPTTSWYYGDPATCSYDTGASTQGDLTTVLSIALPSGINTLKFWSWEETEDFAGYDTRTVLVSTNGTDFVPVWQSSDNSEEWYRASVDLSEYSGENIWLRFAFDSVDDLGNDFTGWYVDDVSVLNEPSLLNIGYLISDQAQNDSATVVTPLIIPPDITVDPGSLEAVLEPSEVATQTLTIDNDGEPGSVLEGSIAAPLFGWLDVQPTHFAIDQGDSKDIDVVFTPAGLDPGVYTATLLLDSNDPDESQVVVPVKLTVPFLRLEKSASLPVAYAGDLLTYVLTSTNATASVLTGVVITDAVPANTIYVAGSASDGGSEAGGVVTWDVGTMDEDEVAARTFAVTVDSLFPLPVISFEDDMENDGGGWVATGLWHQETGAGNCSNSHSPTTSWYYGDATACNYDVGTTAGTLTTIAPILLPDETSELTFWSWEQTEGSFLYDTPTLLISTNGTDFVPIWQSVTSTSLWYPVSIDLSAYAGQGIWLRFSFDTIDDTVNNFKGWYVDDVQIATKTEVINKAYVTSDQAMSNTVTLVTPVIIPPEIEVSPTAISATLAPGELVTKTLIISNTGRGELDWRILVQSDADAFVSAVRDNNQDVTRSNLAPTAISAAVQVPANRSSAQTSTSYAGEPLHKHEPRSYEPKLSVAANFIAADVLLLAAGNVFQIQAMLNAYPDLGTVDVFDARLGTPTLEELLNYETVVVISNEPFANPAAIGDLLADYVDNQGTVVQTVPTFFDASNSGWGLRGRWVADGYSPFIGTGDWFAVSTLGTYEASHPIMEGVDEASDSLRQVMDLAPDANLVASWTDDEFVATKDNVVALNTFISDGSAWTGDIALIVHNSIIWLQGESVPWLSAEPFSGTVASDATQTIEVTFDAGVPEVATSGDYSALLLIRSNDPNERQITVPVTLTVNNPPVAVNDEEDTDEDTPVTVEVLTNDTDEDGDSLTVVAVTQPANGSATTNGTTVTYTPTANIIGADSLTYTVDDGLGGTASATVSITVTSVNDAPIAVDDEASTDEDTSVTIDVLANDTDEEGDALSVESVTQPANGSVTTDGTTAVYSPTANFNGEDSFTYTVSDGDSTDTATVTVTVEAVSDAPEAATISGESEGIIGEAYTFTATVDLALLFAESVEPLANMPVTFTWEATGQTPVVHTGSTTDEVIFTWDTAGEKTVSLTVTNDDGEATAEHEITISTTGPATIDVEASPDAIPADGTSTSTVTATVKSESGDGVEGQEVEFSTDLGTITASALTDENGVAKATLTSETTVATATVTASAGGISATVSVVFEGAGVEGTVFIDDNRNGTQNSGEEGIAGVKITLTPDSGEHRDAITLAVIDQVEPFTTTTDANGNYSMQNMPLGSYEVTMVFPGGYRPTSSEPITVDLNSLDTVTIEPVAALWESAMPFLRRQTP